MLSAGIDHHKSRGKFLAQRLVGRYAKDEVLMPEEAFDFRLAFQRLLSVVGIEDHYAVVNHAVPLALAIDLQRIPLARRAGDSLAGRRHGIQAAGVLVGF